ncbi:MAG TPA: hypothetical protein VLT33_14540, partial [Labilithrix sp.]|nr:hypothetical protein [Labilithrix sp.]
AVVVVPARGRGGVTEEMSALVSRDTTAAERAHAPGSEAVEGTDAIAGTMGYIDPACFGTGDPADPSSDLYALGAMLYECLTGRLPASAAPEGDSLSRLRMTVAMGVEAPPPVRTLAPSVPEGVARVIDALVAPRRKDRPKRAEWVASELERLRRLRRTPSRTLPSDGPFRGLASFDERHRDVYFGRSADIAAALDLLRVRGVLALVGASGAGKSSLARAGVLPAVVDGELGAWPPRWTAVTLSPGERPRAALGLALAAFLEGAPLPDDPDELARSLASVVETTSVGLVILVDALEELVTVTPPAERSWLAGFLAALSVRPTPGLRAVVTARRDLLDPLLAEPALGAALTRAVRLVAPLSAAAWAETVEERLAAYDVSLEDDAMRAELARQLATVAEAMPLVEFGLSRLWEQRDVARRVISVRSLAAIGGLDGALAQHADATLTGLEAAHGLRVVAVTGALLLALTTPHGTRVGRTRSELAREVGDPLLDLALAALEKARLLVSDDGRITIAHDTLIVRWPRLAAWVRSQRRDRELARDVEEAVARWQARPGADLLLRGRPLREARALLTARARMLSDDARSYVRASRRSELRSVTGVVGLAASVFVAAGVLGVVYWQSDRETRAEKAAAEREKTEVAKITQTLLEAANRTPAQRDRDIEQMVQAKHACEKQLARCSGDAGAGPVAPETNGSRD